MLRGDRVIAVDANPDAGNLAHRVAPPHDRTITDVLRDLDTITSYAALRVLHRAGASSRASRCSPRTTTRGSGWPWTATTTTA